MRVSGAGIFLIGMLLLVSSAEAAIPHHMTISGDDWMIADNVDTSAITATILDADNYPVSGAQVTFQVETPWSLTTPGATTGSPGTATTVLDRTTRSGNARVTVTAQKIEDSRMYTIQDTYLQKIDHATPMTLIPQYSGEVTVGSLVPLTAILRDGNGNPCDNRRLVETLTFSSTSPEPAFWDGSSFTERVALPANESGMATASFRVDRVGVNYVIVEGPDPIPPFTIPITGVADGVPSSIRMQVVPDGDPYPSVTADGSSKFLITCHLYDRNGYPAGNRVLDISTSFPGEEVLQKTTNSDGIVQFEYGPKHTVGLITITATAADNEAVTTSQTVEFVSGDAVAMILTANPQSMASRDWNDGITAIVKAKVVDVKGNPVTGETVVFRMTQVDIGSYVQTQPPALELGSRYEENLDADLTAVTGDDGMATITFHPGAFLTDRRSPGWSSSASGTARVQATWNGVPQTIAMTWKNFPYLSVETAVPSRIYRDDPAEIMVRIRGDGWALQPDPIDVVLVTDRSGSMVYDNPDRMYSVRQAAKLFVDNMTGQDAVGLVSFGRKGSVPEAGYNSRLTGYVNNVYPGEPATYPDWATLDRSLGTDLEGVEQDLDRMVPDHGTPMRKALKVAIDELITNARPETVTAIVLLSDGDYNWFGDPLARGTATSWNPEDYTDLTTRYYSFAGLGTGPFSNQNMSEYARSHGIRIYTIAYASSISSGGKATLQILAQTSGGKYYEASASNIGDVYTSISGELHNEAGVDTEMNLDFESVQVNSMPFPPDDVFQYRYIPGKSTRVYSYLDDEVLVNTSFSQVDDWNDDHNLEFTIGTIRLNQVWEANYTVTVLKEGQVRVFDANSTITFNNGQTIGLPDTYLTVLSRNGTGAIGRELHISNLAVMTPDPIHEFADIAWDLSYTGALPVTEKIDRSTDHGQTWAPMSERVVAWDPAMSTIHEEVTLDLRGYLPGEYLIRVSVHTADAPDDAAQTPLTISAISDTPKIKIG